MRYAPTKYEVRELLKARLGNYPDECLCAGVWRMAFAGSSPSRTRPRGRPAEDRTHAALAFLLQHHPGVGAADMMMLESYLGSDDPESCKLPSPEDWTIARGISDDVKRTDALRRLAQPREVLRKRWAARLAKARALLASGQVVVCTGISQEGNTLRFALTTREGGSWIDRAPHLDLACQPRPQG